MKINLLSGLYVNAGTRISLMEAKIMHDLSNTLRLFSHCPLSSICTSCLAFSFCNLPVPMHYVEPKHSIKTESLCPTPETNIMLQIN